MTNYTQATDFSAKDALATGNPEKAISGADIDGEFALISTAIATKLEDVASIASVFDYGAVDNAATDNAAAIQAAIDAVAATYDTALGEFGKKLDFGGVNFRVETPINATGIVQPGFTMFNGGLYGAMSGGIVLDLSLTNSMILKDFRVYGDATTTPDVGILQSTALSGGSYVAAGSHKFFNVQCNGYFNKSALVNFGSEVSGYFGCRFMNRSRGLTAYAVVHAGHAKTLDDNMGGLTSTFQTLPNAAVGARSNVLHYHSQAQIQRLADVNLTVTGVSKHATAPVVTADSGELTAAAFSNGDTVFFHNVVGMTELNGNVYTIQTLNEGAGTFELASTDSSAYTTFVSGTVHNQTGPAMLVGGTDAIKICDGSYLLSYGASCVAVDTEQGGSFRKCEFSFQAEPDNPTIIDFIRDISGQYTVQHFKLEIMNFAQVVGEDFIRVTGTSGGTVRIDNLDLQVISMGTAPSNGLFSDATKFSITNCNISTPLAASMNTITDFVLFGGSVYSADDLVKQVYSLGTTQMKQGTNDLPFIDFSATADADTTSATSTLTTSGTLQYHVQVEINGLKRWLAVYQDPS